MLSFVFCFTTALICTACGKTEIARAYVKSGLESVVVRSDTDTLDTSKVVVTIVFENKKTKDVDASKLEFGTIDLSKIEKQKLSIKIKDYDYSFDYEIEVVASDADVNSIQQFESELINAFNSKRTATEEQSSFYDKDQPLYVGNDNLFDLRILASGEDASGNDVDNIRRVRTTLSMWEVVNEAEILLTQEQIDEIATYDNINTTFKFADSVINRTFKVRIEPVNADEVFAEDLYVEATFTVIDGWNVYDAKNLSIYDNVNEVEIGSVGAWTDLKTQWGLLDTTTNALILQADIKITKEDVPADYFWTKNSQNYADVNTTVAGKIDFLGTPIDRVDGGLYKRKINNGETFNFIGNYFQIDLTEFPKAVIEYRDADPDSMAAAAGAQGYVMVKDDEKETKDSYITSHLSVFYTYTDEDDPIDTETTVNWKNFNFSGNGAITKSPENSGAIILMKNAQTNFYTYNTVTNNFYISYFFEGGNKIQDTRNPLIGEFVVDSCKGYNSFQSLFYLWGADHTIIKNSEFKGAGGPAIIANQANKTGSDINTGRVPKIDVYNSVIESIVTAGSFWFSNYGMGKAATNIAGSDKIFTGVDEEGNKNGLLDTGKTILADKSKQAMNIVVVIMDGMDQCQGYARFFESEEDYFNYYDDSVVDKPNVYGLDMMRDSKQLGGQNLADLAKTTGSNIFESSGNGGIINDNVATNGITTIGYLKVESLYAGLCAMNSAFAQEGRSKVDFNTNLQTLCGLIAGAEQAQAGSIKTVYDLGFTKGWFEEIENASSMENSALLSAVQAQISAWTATGGNYYTGKYINLYTSMNIGAMIEIYDQEA